MWLYYFASYSSLPRDWVLGVKTCSLSFPWVRVVWTPYSLGCRQSSPDDYWSGWSSFWPLGLWVHADLSKPIFLALSPGALHVQQGAHAAGAPACGGRFLHLVLHGHYLCQAGLFHHKGTLLASFLLSFIHFASLIMSIGPCNKPKAESCCPEDSCLWPPLILSVKGL